MSHVQSKAFPNHEYLPMDKIKRERSKHVLHIRDQPTFPCCRLRGHRKYCHHRSLQKCKGTSANKLISKAKKPPSRLTSWCPLANVSKKTPSPLNWSLKPNTSPTPTWRQKISKYAVCYPACTDRECTKKPNHHQTFPSFVHECGNQIPRTKQAYEED